MRLRLKNIIALIVFLVGGFIVVSSLVSSWNYFLTTCPNTDVLSWDANLRFKTVVDIYEDVKDGDLFSPILHTFRSPTWPTLRSNIALLIFFISDDGPNTILDVAISFGFYCLLILLMLFIAWDICRDFLRASIVWLFCSILILHSRQFTVYALSSMLETQGMFFTLGITYYLYKVYEQQRLHRFMQIGGAKNPLKQNKSFLLGLFIFGQGLFHTKYPYGLILVISLSIFEFTRKPFRFFEFIQFSIKQHYKGKRRIILGAIFLIITSLFLVSFISKYTNWLGFDFSLKSKLFRNFIWLVSLLAFIDLNYYIYQFKLELGKLFDTAFRKIYLAIIAPIVFWILLHPDRLGSIIGTQQHKQDASRSFIESFLFDVFDHSEPLYLILIGSSIGLLLFLWLIHRSFSIRQSLAEAIKHPLLAISIILILQFVILEKLTANKQLRHIFHLIPSIIFLASVIIIRIPNLLGLSKSKLGSFTFLFSRFGYILLPLSLLIIYLPKTEDNKLIKESIEIKDSQSLMPRVNYTNGRWLCFTDYNPNIYKPVRTLVNQIEANKNYILFNFLHQLPVSDKRRIIATEFDILLRMHTITKSKIIRNSDYYRKLNWNNFDALLLVKPECKQKIYNQIVQKQIVLNKALLGNTEIFTSPKNELCIEKIDLIR